MKNLLDFYLFVDRHNPDIVALTEIWLSDEVPNSLPTGSHSYRVFFGVVELLPIHGRYLEKGRLAMDLQYLVAPGHSESAEKSGHWAINDRLLDALLELTLRPLGKNANSDA